MGRQIGGARKGAGRKKGGCNRDRAQFVEALRSAADVDELIGKMRELARGVIVEDSRTHMVYAKPPDSNAIAYLLDQAFGRAKQHVEVEGDVGYERFLIGLGKALSESAGPRGSEKTDD
jgi:hypothetical protein